MNPVDISIDRIKPYKNNPRDNSKSIDKVAESIKSFGFLQPIVVDKEGIILAGHTRYAAAQKLGLETVPVLYADKLTSAQARAYRLADNKVSESSKWDEELLVSELDLLGIEDPSFNPADFGFSESSEYRRHKQWEYAKNYCNLDKKIQLRPKCGFYVASLFTTAKEGRTFEEIKSDKNNVVPFADTAADYLIKTYGDNFGNGEWCVCTTPRRRHNNGFHFATAVCEELSGQLGIPFRADVVIAHTRDRIHTNFTLENEPPENNIILYDDIITTGVTMRDTRQLLVDAGHIVMPVVSIKN